ncbi:uncharacterized protein JCM6883_007449 [Sporobolomyces salmoneus]|uniref:uncharacterized protein n=1 Tax=Sporobolomyces salmoneus TaxID=183962 RepID=UPI00316F9E7F
MSVSNGQYYPQAAAATNSSNRTNKLPTSRSESQQLFLQTTHPAAFASDPQAEYSPLEAPALPFSSSGSSRRSRTRSIESTGRQIGSTTLHTRPTSSTSLPSLAIHSSPSLSSATPSPGSTDSFSRREMHGRGLSDAQEELLVEARSDRENGKDVNPYAWERPLDSVNRHSRMLDSSPLATASDSTGRRVSRLPPGVQMLDPFGFSLAAETSPYDLALNASTPSGTAGVLSPSRSPVRASFLQQPQVTSTSASPSPSSSHGHSPFPSSSSIASNLSQTSTAATSPTLQPWTKPRAASAGEVSQVNSRAQFKTGLLGPPTVQRGPSSRSRLSKLSGEIDVETASIASTATQSQLPAFVPADSDYLNSKLYARTIKAQKALEKERLKAASKGKMSRYDSEAAKSTSSLMVPRSSMDTGRPASIFSVASTGKMRTGRRSALGWFKSSSEISLAPPSPDPTSSPNIPLSTSRSSNALHDGPRPTATVYPSYASNIATDPALRSANSSSDYLREARESVVAQKAPTMSSRQTSGSSTGSSGGGEELVRPAPIPIRKSRASPSGSFQQSPTIQESSPPSTPVEESTLAAENPVDPSSIPRPSDLPPPVVPISPPRSTHNPPLDAQSRPASTTPTPHPASTAPSAIPHRISSSTLKPSPAPIDNSTISRAGSSSSSSVRSPSDPPPNGRLPPPPQPSNSQVGRPSQTPTSASTTTQSTIETSRPRQGPASPEKTPKRAASVVPPPLLSPDASLANGDALLAAAPPVGVKRRKSSLGLLFGGGGASRNGKSAPVASPQPASQNGREKEKITRRTEEKASKPESKSIGKEKMKEKVKESFFGRVKRPELPETKPTSSPVSASSPTTPRSRPPPPVTSNPSPMLSSSQPQSQQASRLPPGAQAPVPPYSSNVPLFPSIQPSYSTSTDPRQSNLPEKTTTRAPHSSSSASTTFSTLSSSSSTFPPTPSSGRSTNGLSKSVNGSSSTKSANGGGGGGSAFSNFFSRHRTKSLGPSTPQKLFRSKNSTTPAPEVPVLPSKGGGGGNFVTPLRKSGGTPQAFPGIENYAPPPASNPPNDLLVTSHRGYATYA